MVAGENDPAVSDSPFNDDGTLREMGEPNPNPDDSSVTPAPNENHTDGKENKSDKDALVSEEKIDAFLAQSSTPKEEEKNPIQKAKTENGMITARANRIADQMQEEGISLEEALAKLPNNLKWMEKGIRDILTDPEEQSSGKGISEADIARMVEERISLIQSQKKGETFANTMRELMKSVPDKHFEAYSATAAELQKKYPQMPAEDIHTFALQKAGVPLANPRQSDMDARSAKKSPTGSGRDIRSKTPDADANPNDMSDEEFLAWGDRMARMGR